MIGYNGSRHVVFENLGCFISFVYCKYLEHCHIHYKSLKYFCLVNLLSLYT